MRVKFDLEAPGPNAAVSIRSIVGEAAVSTLERIDMVKLKRRCAAEYSAVRRALTDPAQSALYRSS